MAPRAVALRSPFGNIIIPVGLGPLVNSAREIWGNSECCCLFSTYVMINPQVTLTVDPKAAGNLLLIHQYTSLLSPSTRLTPLSLRDWWVHLPNHFLKAANWITCIFLRASRGTAQRRANVTFTGVQKWKLRFFCRNLPVVYKIWSKERDPTGN